MVKVLLADDHKIVRDGIHSLLEKYPDIEIVGEGANGQEVLDLTDRSDLEVDIVLADLNMPEMDGIVLTEKLRKKNTAVKIVILSMLDHEKYIIQAYKAGINGYLLKNINEDELVFALKQVMSGTFYLCSELSFKILDRLAQSPMIKLTEEAHDLEFSTRELEILTLIAEGYTNTEIADKLFTSKRTVEGHRQQMITRTGMRNTAALIKYAILNGVLV